MNAKLETLVFILIAATQQVSCAGTMEQHSLQSRGAEAIELAQASQKYLFLMFDEGTSCPKDVHEFEGAMEELGGTAQSIRISINDPKEQNLIQQYGLRSAPLPFVLVLAPNGAVMRGLPKKFTKQDLIDSVGTPAMEDSFRALQDEKLVILSVQGSNSKHNTATRQAIQAFQADPRFSEKTVSVFIDRDNPNELRFIQQLGIRADEKDAVTIVIAPPAKILANFTGKTSKEQLISTVEQAVTGSCCPGGNCCSGKNCK